MRLRSSFRVGTVGAPAGCRRGSGRCRRSAFRARRPARNVGGHLGRGVARARPPPGAASPRRRTNDGFAHDRHGGRRQCHRDVDRRGSRSRIRSTRPGPFRGLGVRHGVDAARGTVHEPRRRSDRHRPARAPLSPGRGGGLSRRARTRGRRGPSAVGASTVPLPGAGVGSHLDRRGALDVLRTEGRTPDRSLALLTRGGADLFLGPAASTGGARGVSRPVASGAIRPLDRDRREADGTGVRPDLPEIGADPATALGDRLPRSPARDLPR